jgi:L-asparagine transporter-like permease
VADDNTEREVGRRRPDVFTLIMGIATLGVSGFVLSDGEMWFPEVDPRWVVAGVALVVGVIMLGASVRGRKR